MNTPTILITPLRSALLSGHDNELELLVRIQAPPVPDELPVRAPLNLALVIDRSGSMSGQPLAEAKRCAAMIVDNLDPDDHVSLITYDDQVEANIPCGRVADRAHLHRAIRAIHSGGMTALYDGWYEGAGQAALAVEQSGVSRVLLLSDGQANEGLTDIHDIASRCAGMADVGVTTSTYGLGHGFNEELMVRMARSGMGNSYYGQTAEDLLDPFREEFELLQNLCCQKLNLKISAPDGVSVRVLNGYSGNVDQGWRMPDLAFGGEAWAALRMKVPCAVEGMEGNLLDVELSFEDRNSEICRLESTGLKLPWLIEEAYAATAVDSIVEARFTELRAADLQDDARLAAKRGDWDQVDILFSRARKEVKNNPWLNETIDELEGYASRRESELLAKESMYQSTNLRARLADASQSPDVYDMTAESSKAAYLRRKRQRGKRF